MHKPTWKVPEVALSFLQDNTPGNKLRLTCQTKMQKQQPHAHTQIWKRSEEIDNMWIRMNTTEYRWTYMNSLNCIRWYKHAETLAIKSKQRPNHFYFMNCTCCVRTSMNKPKVHVWCRPFPFWDAVCFHTTLKKFQNKQKTTSQMFCKIITSKQKLRGCFHHVFTIFLKTKTYIYTESVFFAWVLTTSDHILKVFKVFPIFAWLSLRVRAIKSAGGPKEGEGRRRGGIKGDQTPIFGWFIYLVRY